MIFYAFEIIFCDQEVHLYRVFLFCLSDLFNIAVFEGIK